MSKNLEQEYRAYTDQSTPDLWGRIEAALPEKQPVISEKQKRSDRRKLSVIRWSGLIAAGVCLALLIPALVHLNRTGRKASDRCELTDSTASDRNFAYSAGTSADPTEGEANFDLDMEVCEESSCDSAEPDLECGNSMTESNKLYEDDSEAATEDSLREGGTGGEIWKVSVREVTGIEGEESLWEVCAVTADGEEATVYVRAEAHQLTAENGVFKELVPAGEQYDGRPVYRIREE